MNINVKIKYFLTLTALFVLLLPGIGMASAQPNDPRCFTEEECSATRASLATIGNTEESGFYQGQDAKNTCGEQIYNSAGELENAGFCAPVGAPKTQIKFAGQQEFGNIAEFIRYIYKYSMIAGITISILMIIVAGLQYVTSAGEQTKITSAKKRISGAIMGLVLLATSYTILNTINPALVNLRLPQVWLIKSENVAPLWCADLQTNIPLALAGPAGGERTQEFSAALFERTSDTRTTSTAECGSSFYLATNGQTCLGSKCEQTTARPPLPQTCVLESGGGTGCLQGNIVGRVYSSAFMATASGIRGAVTRLTAGLLVGADEGWSWPWIPTSGSGDFTINTICENGAFRAIEAELNPSLTNHPGPAYSQVFGFYIPPSAITDETAWCEGQTPPSTLKGFALAFDFEEFQDGAHEEHHVGNNNGQGIDLGNTSDESQQNCLLRLDSIRQHLIKPTDLTNGVSIIIDMAQIADIDPGREDRNAAYSWLGYGWDACTGLSPTQSTQLQELIQTEIDRTTAACREDIIDTTAESGNNLEARNSCPRLLRYCIQNDNPFWIYIPNEILEQLKQSACRNMSLICSDMLHEDSEIYNRNLYNAQFLQEYCQRLPV